MACFLVSATEALVVTAAAQVVKHREAGKEVPPDVQPEDLTLREKFPWSRRLMLLAYLLWGGVVLLAFEHVWHGEVVPWFPFLTAMNSPGDTQEMLHEMATVGVSMACLITVVWGCMVSAICSILKRPAPAFQSGQN